VTSIPEPISRDLSEINILHCISRLCAKEMPATFKVHRCTRYDRPGAKRRRKKRVGFVKQKRAKTVVAIEALGDMLRALQIRGF